MMIYTILKQLQWRRKELLIDDAEYFALFLLSFKLEWFLQWIALMLPNIFKPDASQLGSSNLVIFLYKLENPPSNS